MVDYERRSDGDYEDYSNLRIQVLRSGDVAEVATLLFNLDAAYSAIWSFDLEVNRLDRYGRRYWREPFWSAPTGGYSDISPTSRLQLSGIEIHSPGWLEAVGAWNPLQQLREYLTDRHERRKDHEYREAAEASKMRLERDLLEKQIEEKDLENLARQVDILRSIGMTKAECRQLVWERRGRHLARLGSHQDSGLIAGPVDLDGDIRRDR